MRYFLFHRVVSGSFVLAFSVGFSVLGYWLVAGEPIPTEFHERTNTTVGDWTFATIYMFAAFLILDFLGWFTHYLQHKFPLLWQFHKVHHSAEVMHPISNFREHPIDNITYISVFSFYTGLSYALLVRWIGFVPAMPTVLGVPILMFVFDFVAYNLRHSHVWLRWPGVWSKVFPPPAHHHLHHSCHPDHIDKNFAFMFPLCDVVFGTYLMPKDNRDVKFGVPEEQGRDLDSVLSLYWVPFRDAYRILFPKKR